MAKSAHTAKLDLSTGLTVAGLSGWLRSIPDEATITASYTPRDRPFDSEYYHLTARWTVDVNE